MTNAGACPSVSQSALEVDLAPVTPELERLPADMSFGERDGAGVVLGLDRFEGQYVAAARVHEIESVIRHGLCLPDQAHAPSLHSTIAPASGIDPVGLGWERRRSLRCPHRRLMPGAPPLSLAGAVGPGEACGRPPSAQDRAKWDAMKRTLRHLMIAAAILGVAAALLFLIVADAMCIGDFCRSDP